MSGLCYTRGMEAMRQVPATAEQRLAWVAAFVDTAARVGSGHRLVLSIQSPRLEQLLRLRAWAGGRVVTLKSGSSLWTVRGETSERLVTRLLESRLLSLDTHSQLVEALLRWRKRPKLGRPVGSGRKAMRNARPRVF